ncbi:MAG: hypothetical protein K2K30_06480 [Alistipes sp.]|nr:hypothetical protein [Alistipes sp.]
MKPMRNVPDLKFEPDWRRLKFAIEQSGMSNEEFAEFAQLDDPGIITHIRYAQCGIDEKLAKQINRAFPQIPTDWLLGRPGAPLPEPANMFPEIKEKEDRMFQAFEQAEAEFKATIPVISRSLIRLMPCADITQIPTKELDDDINRLLDLLENMRHNTLPATRDRLHEAAYLCDELCCAAAKFGLPL